MALFRNELASNRITRLSATKAEYNNIYNISSDSFFGVTSSSINATAIPSGVSATSQIGTVTATGSSSVDATATPSGLNTTSSIGISAESAEALKEVSGVSVASQIGAVVATATNVLNGNAIVNGVSASSSIGSVTLSAEANATATTEALSIVGNPAVVSGDSNVINDGAESTPSIGSTLQSGTALKAVIGLNTLSSIGSPSANGNAKASPAGVSVSSIVGTPTATGTVVINGNATPSGVTVSADIGTDTAKGGAGSTPSGVSVSSDVGGPTATGTVVINGTASPQGVSTSTNIGTANASVSASANVFIDGVGVVSSLSPSVLYGDASIELNGVNCVKSIGAGVPLAYVDASLLIQLIVADASIPVVGSNIILLPFVAGVFDPEHVGGVEILGVDANSVEVPLIGDASICA